jgi:hypothetical protein
LNDVREGVARGIVILRVKQPSADRSRLIGQQVEFVIGDVNSPGSLFGLLADAITLSFECCSDNRYFFGDTPSVKLSGHTIRQRWL